MSELAVTKMHGAGNDFIVIDARTHPVERLPAFAVAFCARHTGVGADGVLTIERHASGNPFMRVTNADGSEAEMCGNGIRCVAAYLDRSGEMPSIVVTRSGNVRVEIVGRDPYEVRIALPVHGIEPFSHEGASGAFVDMGNPHVVLPAQSFPDIVALAQTLTASPQFSAGTNVHLTSRTGADAIVVTHHERGAGLTQACGSGAVAAAVAAIRYDNAPQRLRVRVPGGELHVEWDGGPIAQLTGPAAFVFTATVQWP